MPGARFPDPMVPARPIGLCEQRVRLGHDTEKSARVVDNEHATDVRRRVAMDDLGVRWYTDSGSQLARVIKPRTVTGASTSIAIQCGSVSGANVGTGIRHRGGPEHGAGVSIHPLPTNLSVLPEGSFPDHVVAAQSRRSPTGGELVVVVRPRRLVTCGTPQWQGRLALAIPGVGVPSSKGGRIQ